jgi:uncharacterized membrane protein
MKSFTRFLRTTIAGGILFLIPLVILASVAKKGLKFLEPITAPWDRTLPDNFLWGLDGSNLIGIGILLLISFVAGLIFKVSVVKSSISKIEENFLSYIPGYAFLKSMATEALGRSDETSLRPVLVKDEDKYLLGFLVEQRGTLCTVFIPEAPQANSGDVQIVLEECVIKLSITSNAMKFIIRNLGKGAADLIPNVNGSTPNRK